MKLVARCLAVALVALSSALVPIAGCKSSSSAGGAPSASSTPSAAPFGSEGAHEDADVRPVYPPLTGPAHPLATKLCGALYGVYGARRGECCGHKPQPGLDTECERNLSGALALGAIDLAEADIDRCAEAVRKEATGCDWITPGGQLPTAPPECSGVVKGKLASGTRCRSSLECEGKLRCHGVGPTTVGVCAPAKAQGSCGGSADVLATYVREDGVDKRHPECTELCGRRRCEPFAKLGEDCKFDGACGTKAHCEKGKCAAGDVAKAGEACINGACARGSRCVKGKCAPPLAEGSACAEDAQCRGGCVKAPGATEGTCAKECSRVFSIPLPSGSALPKKK